MTTLENTVFALLEQDKRLQNPVFKGATPTSNRYGFRGEIAIKFSAQLADEARPPEILAGQVMATASENKPGMEFMAAYLLSFEYVKSLFDVMQTVLVPEGKYFLFCNNMDLLKKYQVKLGQVWFYILPIDEATVYNELLEMIGLEKNDLKKSGTAEKLDAVANAALRFSGGFPQITYDEGLALMGPVRNPNENRPV